MYAHASRPLAAAVVVFGLAWASRAADPPMAQPSGRLTVSEGPPPSSPADEQFRAGVRDLGGKFVAKGLKASWSPDQKRLVFGRLAHELAIVDLSTGKITELARPGFDPSWSPGDGRWIAYVSGRSPPEQEVWLIETASGRKWKVADGGFPSWSADGKALYYHSRKQVVLMALSVGSEGPTGEPRLVLNTPYEFPVISPDGRQIAHAVGRQIVIADRQDKKPRRTWEFPGSQGLLLGWSPDGKRIGAGAFGYPDVTGLCLFDVDDGAMTRVCPGPVTMPVWSPDGSKLALDVRLAGGPEIWVLDTKALDQFHRGKAGTAVVLLQPSSSRPPSAGSLKPATAFCVHASGLFLTGLQPLQPADQISQISLVLDKGLKTERKVTAKVVRTDPQFDLALLRAEGEHKLLALPLATADEITEQTRLTVFGYPVDTRWQAGDIQVHAATVTAVQRESGAPHRLSLSPMQIRGGSNGGPALDSEGHVVALVTAYGGGNAYQGIPVAQLRRFVAGLDVQFQPPALSVARQHEPAEFKARVVSFVPLSKPVTLELRLRAGDQPERIHKMELAGEVYRVTATPLPVPEGGVPLRLTASYGGDTLTGLTADRAFTLGQRKLRLSEVRDLQAGPPVQAKLRDGTTAEGALAELDAVEVRLGTDTLRLNLARATAVRFEIPVVTENITYNLVACQEAKEVLRLSGTLPIQDGITSGGTARSSSGSDAFAPEKTTCKLPAPVEDVAVGGGGRYLILHLPKIRKLAIFDAQTAQIARSLDCAEDRILFTAGLDKLLVVLPTAKVMQRWDLHTGERETTTPITFKGIVKGICMGSAATRPVLLHGVADARDLEPAAGSGGFGGMPGAGGQTVLHFMDLRTFKIVNAEPLRSQFLGFQQGQEVLHLRASPDGKVYGMWCTSQSPEGLHTIVVSSGRVQLHYEHTSVGFVVPGPDNRTIFSEQGFFTLEGQPKSRSDRQDPALVLPARQGNYYLRIAPRAGPGPVSMLPNPQGQAERQAGVSIHVLGDARPLLTLQDIPVVETRSSPLRHDFTTDKRLHFLPEHNLLVTIPTAADELVLYRFDLLDAMAKSGLDRPFVTSQPPTTATKGATFAYQVEVKSNRGSLQYKVESGPRNLAVSPKGKITWQVPERAEADVPVIISVRDASGQECLHGFTLRIED